MRPGLEYRMAGYSYSGFPEERCSANWVLVVNVVGLLAVGLGTGTLITGAAVATHCLPSVGVSIHYPKYNPSLLKCRIRRCQHSGRLT